MAKGRVAAGGHVYSAGQMLVFGRDAAPTITAEEPATIMLLGGEPLGERFIWWNFVSSRRERIEQAKADWKAGRIALPPNDNAERSEEHTSELQSLMRISYAVFCLKKKIQKKQSEITNKKHKAKVES